MALAMKYPSTARVIAPDSYARQRAALLHVTDLVDAGSYDFSSHCYVIAEMGWAWMDRTDVPDAVAKALIDLLAEWHDRPNGLHQRDVTHRVRQVIGGE
jgi:hypothetical protein